MTSEQLTKTLCTFIGTPFTTFDKKKRVVIHKDNKLFNVKDCFIPKNDQDTIVIVCGDEEQPVHL